MFVKAVRAMYAFSPILRIRYFRISARVFISLWDRQNAVKPNHNLCRLSYEHAFDLFAN